MKPFTDNHNKEYEPDADLHLSFNLKSSVHSDLHLMNAFYKT